MQRQIVARTASRWVLGALLALLPLAGHSLGLGKLQLKSALNEPLNAEIDITSIADNELKGLSVSMAPRADFEAAGAERLPLLSQIKFTVARRPDGRYYLQMKTDAPIEEPFLHVLLQLEWPGGRLVREYTALIDPPSYVAGAPAAVESPQTAPEAVAEPTKSPFVDTVPPPAPTGEQAEPQLAAPAAPIPEPLTARASEPQPVDSAEPQPTESAPQQVTIPAPTEQTSDPASDQPSPSAQLPQVAGDPTANWANNFEYTVRPGDTLWSIAERVRTDKQLTLEQVILAIFRNNPDAFFRDNVNNLRAGKVLTIPERDAVDATPVSEARREFRAQYDAWQEYKLKLAAGSRTLKVADAEPAATAPPAPEAESKPGDAAAKPAAPSEDLLKIVRSADAEKSAPGDKAQGESAKSVEAREQTALAERVSTLEESLESKQMENRELAEKIGQVRTQIKNEKRLIELENQTLAQQTAKPTATAPEAAKPEPVKPEVKPEVVPPTQGQPPAAAPVQPAKPAPRTPVVVPPLPEKNFFESLLSDVMDETVLPIVGGVVALLGIVILMVYFRRRRRSIAEFEESILASDAIATDAMQTSSETTGQATTGDTSFLSDFSKGGMGQVHTDEVDPVAEAEVYLAYGRDETAEEILKEAIVKHPERHELKQKLLDIYHQRNDVNAFETLAEELYAALGGRGGKIWEKVEEMGRKLNPDNPMFRGGAPERRAAEKVAAPVTAPVARSNPMMEETYAVGGMAMGATASAATQVVDKGAVDFDFDAAPAPAAAEPSLDFDLNTADLTSDMAPAKAGRDDDLASLDFGAAADNLVDFSSSKGGTSADASLEFDAPAAAADDEIKWEVDAPMVEAAASEAIETGNGVDDGANGHWDETATKLDLAKAYIDMGDAEGARSILDEVLAEGNDNQKKQAAELAAQIA